MRAAKFFDYSVHVYVLVWYVYMYECFCFIYTHMHTHVHVNPSSILFVSLNLIEFISVALQRVIDNNIH